MQRSLDEVLDPETMPRMTKAVFEASAEDDAFWAYLDEVGAIAVTDADEVIGYVMSVEVKEQFEAQHAAVHAELTAARAETEALRAQNHTLQWKLRHLGRRQLRRCRVLERPRRA